MATVPLGEAEWTMGKLRLETTASASLKARPDTRLCNDGDFWITRGHDFHLYLSIFFDESARGMTEETALGEKNVTSIDRLVEHLGYVFVQASVGGARSVCGSC